MFLIQFSLILSAQYPAQKQCQQRKEIQMTWGTAIVENSYFKSKHFKLEQAVNSLQAQHAL